MLEDETEEFKKTTGELSEGIASIVNILSKHRHGELLLGRGMRSKSKNID